MKFKFTPASALVFLMVFVILFFSGCKMSSISMRVLVPADINVPANIKKVGIANRSLPDKHNRLLNIAEGILTGESVFADREGSENCVRGLVEQLNNSPRFTAVLVSGENLTGTGTRIFPMPLDPAILDEICKKYGIDALILLETFDSDLRLNQSQRTVEKTNKEGVKYNEVEYLANFVINVRSGWRIYDYQTKKILDESVFTDAKSWNAKGPNPTQAVRNLPSKRMAINESGFFSGTMYGRRISPNWMNVSRSYYAKGTSEFKRARRLVRTSNWDAAEEIWKSFVNSTDPKLAGRATYNMALVSEVKGDLQTALQWSNKAYVNFGIRKARNYSAVLQRRIYDQERLNRQMEGQ